MPLQSATGLDDRHSSLYVGKMSKLLHFSTIDVDSAAVAAVGVIPLPGNQSRVRIFLTGGGVIDITEKREEARQIWLGEDSDELRMSRLVEQNSQLREAFDQVHSALRMASEQSTREDMWSCIVSSRQQLSKVAG